ncbi:MAG: GmrSD restriction endonuclease domain-containing protein, partial [Candidatus Humimicrobiaceae bacterium]
MDAAKFAVNNFPISFILNNIETNQIAIPEIQRPFVWDSTRVRDLLDSLYRGYPIGYIILWQNPDIMTKEGKLAHGKRIIIDGQQRVIALSAAVLGNEIIDKNFKRIKITIAFHPMQEKFEVLNSIIAKDHTWIHDISTVIKDGENLFKTVKEYSKNNEIPEDIIFNKLSRLSQIKNLQIGVIDLAYSLDIETVTEIFIRINSQGVILNQADFAMSKIAADSKYDGQNLRKCIDYFCHMAAHPDFYHNIKDVDKTFTSTEHFQKISWLKDEVDDLYDPSYLDMLRVAFTYEFNRGILSDLVSLLSGRNFETKSYEERIMEESFLKLNKGIHTFINENNFKNFIMLIKSSGYNSPSLITSQNALNFAYVLYLKLKALGYKEPQTHSLVRRWFVLSSLTGRYSSSTESNFDSDIKQISNNDFRDFLKLTEEAVLSDSFWDVALVQNLNTSGTGNPYFNAFLAAQVKSGDEGFVSPLFSVSNLVSIKGDIHHIFPRDFLKKNNFIKTQYNQVANYAIVHPIINIMIGNKSPKQYFQEIREKIADDKNDSFSSEDALLKNLKMNCVPEDIFN